MTKTHSQKIAVLLIIMNTLPALFAAFCLLASICILLLVGGDRSANDPVYTQSSDAIYAQYGMVFFWILLLVGLTQYVGYVWHEVYLLSRQKSLMLWISTIIYNGLLAIANLCYTIPFFSQQPDGFSDMGYLLGYLFGHLFFCLTALGLSISALVTDLKNT